MAKDKFDPAAKDGQDGDQGSPKSSKGLFNATGVLYEKAPAPRWGSTLGAELRIGEALDQNYGKEATCVYPGVTALCISPAYGVAHDSSDAINIAFLDIYKRMQVAMKNRNLPFDKVAVALHLICLETPYLIYEELKRVRRALFTTSKYNKYIGRATVAAMGYDFDDLLANKSLFDEYLIYWANLINKYPLPKQFPVVQDHMDMFSQIYADKTCEKPQIYVPRLCYVADYSSVDATNAISAYEWHSPADETQLRKFVDIMNGMNRILNAIADSSDFDRINAGIISTFEESDCYKCTAPTEDEALSIDFNESFNDALANAVLVPDIVPGSLYPYQHNGPSSVDNFLTIEPVTNTRHYNHYVINSRKEDVTSVDYVNMMRWRTVFSANANASAKYYIMTCGPEIVHGLLAYSLSGGEYLYHEGADAAIPNVDFFGSMSESYFYADGVTGSLARCMTYLAAYSIWPTFVMVTTIDAIMTPFSSLDFVGTTNTNDVAAAHRALWWRNYVGE